MSSINLIKNSKAGNLSLFFTLTLTLFMFTSCENSTIELKEKVNPFSEQKNTEKHSEETLHLNNSQKWEVVPEMMAYLKYMKEDVAKFEGKALSEYQNLGTDLSINVDLLTANCTMKGEAHDQLHVWLVPYIGLVNDFAVAENVEAAEGKLGKLKIAFNEFDQYFE